jgi:nucleoid DNA-binding protein
MTDKTQRTLTRVSLAQAAHLQSGVPMLLTRDVISQILRLISDELVLGNAAMLSNFGRFEPVKRNARFGRNVAASTVVAIPPWVDIRFKPSRKTAQATASGGRRTLGEQPAPLPAD